MPKPEFKDHFSGHASQYQKYRPSYPKEMFEYLSTLCVGLKLALDVGTGNGQAARQLTHFFDHVVATDPSENQINSAEPHAKIDFKVARAETCPVPDSSVDLLTVVQALHWFDFEKFFNEAQRVLKDEGVLAAWSYTHASVNAEIDNVYFKYYEDIVGEFWPDERRHVENKYSQIDFPISHIQPPVFEISLNYTLENYIAYLGTWSASKNYRQEKKAEPLNSIKEDLEQVWGKASVRKITWPIYLRVGTFVK